MTQPFDDKDVLLRWTTDSETCRFYEDTCPSEYALVKTINFIRYWIRTLPNGHWFSNSMSAHSYVVRLLEDRNDLLQQIATLEEALGRGGSHEG